MIRLVVSLAFLLALTFFGGGRVEPAIATVDTVEQTPDDDTTRTTLGATSSSTQEDDDDTSPFSVDEAEAPREMLLPVPDRVAAAPVHDVVQALVAPPEPPPPRV